MSGEPSPVHAPTDQRIVIDQRARVLRVHRVHRGHVQADRGAVAGLRGVGLKPSIQQYSFCTNGSHYAGEAGIPTVGFGPSTERLAHTIDEYIEIDQLVGAAQGFYGIMQSVCGVKG